MAYESTARNREVAYGLRAARTARHMGLRETARRASFSPSKTTSWELGLRRISKVDAAIYLASCGTPGPERDRLLEIIEPTNDLYWVRPDEGLRSLVFQETLASTIVQYQSLILPGLLKTEGYARAIFEDWGHPPEVVDRLTDRRIQRQDLFQRAEPPACTFLIREAVLDTVVGSPRIMQEQLQYLLLFANLPHCAVRVIPKDTRVLQTLTDPFVLLTFAEHPATVYMDNSGTGLFIDHRPAVEEYFALATRLEQASLSEGKSREILARKAGEYEQA